MSTIAVLLGLGGGAYAAAMAPANTVNSRAIVNGQVKGADIATGAVTRGKLAVAAVTGAKVADGSLTGAKVSGDSLTGAQIDESTLARVPNADKLDGIDASGFQQAGASAGGDFAGTYPNPTIAAGAVGTSAFGTIPAASLDQPWANMCGMTGPFSGTAAVLEWRGSEFDTEALAKAATVAPWTLCGMPMYDGLRAPMAGTYVITGNLIWMAPGGPSPAIGERRIELFDGGTTLAASEMQAVTDSGHATQQSAETVAHLAVGDLVQLRAYQDSGITVDWSAAHLGMVWVGP